MAGEGRPIDTDVARLVSEHYEDVKMDDAFRRSLQRDTRRMVATGSRRRMRSWLVGLTGAAAGLVLLYLLCGQFHAPAVRDHRDYARTPDGPGSAPHTLRPDAPVPGSPRLHGGPRAHPSTSAPQMVDVASGYLGSSRTGSRRGLSADVAKGNLAMPGAVAGADPAGADILPGEPMLAVVAAHGPVWDSAQHRVRAGSRLLVGSTVFTGRNGRVIMVTRQGSEMDLDSESRLALTSLASAALEKGRLFCSNRMHELSVISTPAGRIELLGTALNAAVIDRGAVAVTVVEGRVELVNEHGKAVVNAGSRSILDATTPPGGGTPANTLAETAWCDRIGDVESDFGEVAYTVEREKDVATEVWVMNADGSSRRRVRSYLGAVEGLGPWVPAQQWVLAEVVGLGFRLPDPVTRDAVAPPSQEIVEKQKWFLDAGTGQGVPLKFSARYRPYLFSFSPDGTRIAFPGEYHYEPSNWTMIRRGIWLYDLRTRSISQLLTGACDSSPAWAPDGRRIVATIDGAGVADSRLVLADTETREVTDLGICGAEPSFSPDGSRIVYVSRSIEGLDPASGSAIRASVLVRHLQGDQSILRLTSEAPGEIASAPHWSPDGARVLYYQRGSGLHVVRADDTRDTLICAEDVLANNRVLSTVGSEPRLGWTRTGDAVYLTTDSGVLLFASDGSGLEANLSEENGGSALSAEERTQTDQAIADIREAVSMYARGIVSSFEGRTMESRAAFQMAADLFSQLVWRYPLAGFATSDVLRYADKAQRLASLTDGQLLADSCWQHMRYVRGLISNWGGDKRVPMSLADLEQWALENGSSKLTHISWLEGSDAEHVRMAFRCPGTNLRLPADYVYTPPQDGVLPKLGTNMVVCPNHASHLIRWYDCQAWGNNPAPRPMIVPSRAPYSQ